MKVDLGSYAAVIADYDGTLVDSQPLNYRCLAAALEPHGVVLEEAWYRARLGMSGEDLLEELGVAALAAPVLAACGDLIIGQLARLRVYTDVVTWIDHARAGGVGCAVASGGAGPVVRAGLTATGLAHLFSVVVTREDAERGKPAPDLFLEAAQRLQVPPGRCVVLEDADEGLEAARAAGMAAVDVRPHVSSSW